MLLRSKLLQVMPAKLRDSAKILWFMSRIPMLYENLNCNGLVEVMGTYLVSEHLYSTICVLQT
jgi:hypothetical protein